MANSMPTEDATAAPASALSLRERITGVDPIVLAAGAAVAGAVAGALVPRSATEARLLAPVGKHVRQAGKALGVAARQALSAELAGVPIVGPIAAEQIDRVIDSVVQPIATAQEDADFPDGEVV